MPGNHILLSFVQGSFSIFWAFFLFFFFYLGEVVDIWWRNSSSEVHGHIYCFLQNVHILYKTQPRCSEEKHFPFTQVRIYHKVIQKLVTEVCIDAAAINKGLVWHRIEYFLLYIGLKAKILTRDKVGKKNRESPQATVTLGCKKPRTRIYVFNHLHPRRGSLTTSLLVMLPLQCRHRTFLPAGWIICAPYRHSFHSRKGIPTSPGQRRVSAWCSKTNCCAYSGNVLLQQQQPSRKQPGMQVFPCPET